MKITKNRLKQIIKEELSKLQEYVVPNAYRIEVKDEGSYYKVTLYQGTKEIASEDADIMLGDTVEGTINSLLSDNGLSRENVAIPEVWSGST